MKNLCKCDKCGIIQKMQYFPHDNEYDIPNDWSEKNGNDYCNFCSAEGCNCTNCGKL